MGLWEPSVSISAATPLPSPNGSPIGLREGYSLLWGRERITILKEI